MPDPRQTVERIRTMLDAAQRVEAAELATIAADYSQYCREANFRLRRCADFLRDGFVGEAVDQAGNKPPLLDLVGVLEFPELAEWGHTCDDAGIPRASRVAVENVPALAQAFEKHEPLRELLAKNRYLALARAPVADRLVILRQLIAADPGNAGWTRDAEELERMRLADLRNEAAAALRAGDADGIARLLAELNAGPWQTPGAEEFKATLSQTATALYQSTAIERLRALVPAVRQAGASGSFEQAQQVFAQWGRVVKTSKISVPADLRQEILPLALWLDEQEDFREGEREFREACANLAATIRSRAPLELLTKRYREAAGFSTPIPDELSSLYRRELQAAQRQQRTEKRKQLALAASLVGAIVLALAALGYMLFGPGKT